MSICDFIFEDLFIYWLSASTARSMNTEHAAKLGCGFESEVRFRIGLIGGVEIVRF